MLNMASMQEKYDTALIGILQNEGQIAKFLDVMLGFLYRRTDFYRIMKTEHDKLGFPPGVAMKLLLNIFKKYESLAAQDEIKRQKLLQERVSHTEETETVRKEASSKTSSLSSETSTAHSPHPKFEQAASPSHELTSVSTKPFAPAETEEEKRPSDSQRVVDKAITDENISLKMEADKSSPTSSEEDQERQQKTFQANPESYNGAVRENYSWSQSITDVDIRVKVPSTISKGKDVKVEIGKKRLFVGYRGECGEWVEAVKGDLIWEVKAEDSMWTLSPGQHVHINLDKKEERWWEAVFVDEPKINTRKIDCSRPITDLDAEAQAKIEEMMYNEHRKQLGLPQSHEQKTLDMLRQAWNAEGSPFRGQPFDPSAISVDPSGVVKIK